MEEAVRKMQAFPKSDDFAVLLGMNRYQEEEIRN